MFIVVHTFIVMYSSLRFLLLAFPCKAQPSWNFRYNPADSSSWIPSAQQPHRSHDQWVVQGSGGGYGRTNQWANHHHATSGWVLQTPSSTNTQFSQHSHNLTPLDPSGSLRTHPYDDYVLQVPTTNAITDEAASMQAALRVQSDSSETSYPSAQPSQTPNGPQSDWVLQQPGADTLPNSNILGDTSGVFVDGPNTPAVVTAYRPVSNAPPNDEVPSEAGLLAQEQACAVGILGDGPGQTCQSGTSRSAGSSGPATPVPAEMEQIHPEPNRYAFIGREFVMINNGTADADEASDEIGDVPSSVTTSLPTQGLAHEIAEDLGLQQDIDPINNNNPSFEPRTDELKFKFPNCPMACEAAWLGDDWCDLDCNVAECGFDGGDCYDWCLPGCPADWLGDGECDEECNNDECENDGGDCDMGTD
eukprot:GHVN01068362.1.p1 GENE.GHVN01068362.1~~GHVN01068362.1.p1  ORF type:complete len:418 (+),score=42.48 GHVN01068362.1:53-1306(+)